MNSSQTSSGPGINGSGEFVRSWSAWLSWDLKRQGEAWRTSPGFKAMYEKMKGRRPADKAVATPRDNYGSKSSGR